MNVASDTSEPTENEADVNFVEQTENEADMKENADKA